MKFILKNKEYEIKVPFDSVENIIINEIVKPSITPNNMVIKNRPCECVVHLFDNGYINLTISNIDEIIEKMQEYYKWRKNEIYVQ